MRLAARNINMRSNWARSAIGTPAFVELEKTRAISHTTIGAIHPSGVIHVTMKESPTRKPKPFKLAANKGEKSKKKELANGKQIAVYERAT
ncbi:unnamed protein product [Mucor hiemalis]